MLDLTVGGKMLCKFLLRDDGDRRVCAKQNGARRRRTLVDGKVVSGHAFSLNLLWRSRQAHFHQRLPACASRSLAPTIDKCCNQRSQDVIVLIKSMETVIGPTPPGTGVIYEAFAATPAKSTSPTSLPSGRRLIPTSITTAPVLTICGRSRAERSLSG